MNIRVDVKEATERQAYVVMDEFMPDLDNRFGYQLGFYSGLCHKRPVNPFVYKGRTWPVMLACPLYDGYRPALQLKTAVTKVANGTYTPVLDVLADQVAKRQAFVLAPSADGEFTVLYVSDNPDDKHRIEERQYNYQKAFNDLSKRFNSVVAEIVTWLTAGELNDA